MVSQPAAADDQPNYYDDLTEQWPSERPSRKRAYRRKDNRRVVVRGERLETPDVVRLSRALLLAQRELAKAEAEQAARNQEPGNG